MFKLKTCLPNTKYMLLKSYLQGRFFQVKYDDHLFSPRNIEVGVPQGSVLGTALYTVYIDGIPTSEEVMTTTYANDTPQLFCCKNPETASSRLLLHQQSWFLSRKIED